MKHAIPAALESLSPLLSALRQQPALQERRLGVFYLRSQAFLHFHEDATGLFADTKFNEGSFERSPVNTPGEQAALMLMVQRTLLALA